MSHPLQEHLRKRRSGSQSGIYSVCSAHPWVLQAAAEQTAEDGTLLLVEATSNQVNQFGGYTGMNPATFREFVLDQARAADLPKQALILGGDHLGPNPWRNLAAADAMRHAETMITDFVRGGFTKIHLDASMPCGGDPECLSDEIIAQRTIQLCSAAEQARDPAGPSLVYVVGSEVPTPGGATHSLHGLQVTSPSAAAQTLAVFRQAFSDAGLSDAWTRVIALVVQPGVEFDNDSVVHYDRQKAKPLVDWLHTQPAQIVFEAHSTDYQLPPAFRELVEDGFAILKVGPALTFAMREALYALADIESQLLPDADRSHLAQVVEQTMLREPADWQQHYAGSPAHRKLLRTYSYSDRIRYYWQSPDISQSVAQLVSNLTAANIPETMYSRYLPAQYARLRSGEIQGDPVSLIVDHIRDVLRVYASAANPG